MGTTALALVTALVATATSAAHAETCTGITDAGGRFATCFDLGNRLSITAGSDGVGGGIAVRHIVKFEDDPDLVWKLEHQFLEVARAGIADQFSGVVYRGRFVRHTRDGHIVIPLGTPKKIFLPFDIGALFEVGKLESKPDMTARIGIVKTAALIDLWRSRDFRRRFALGPVARWGVALERDPISIAQHVVVPFTAGIANFRFESADGLLAGELTVEAGTAWRSTGGWTPEALAEATLERILLAINDRPIALTLGVRYASATDEATARIGARIVLFQHHDTRVSLDPPRTASR